MAYNLLYVLGGVVIASLVWLPFFVRQDARIFEMRVIRDAAITNAFWQGANSRKPARDASGRFISKKG